MDTGPGEGMATDHSATYRQFALRNLPHVLRLRAIERAVRRLAPSPGGAYADFGCSNGFITERVAALIAPRSSTGFDHTDENLRIGAAQHTHISFRRIDLNREPSVELPRFDVVTCFETFEHVGDLNNALSTVVASIKPGGLGIFTVPIETGPKGTIKFLVKTLFYRYKLEELPQQKRLYFRYLKSLLTNERISRYRPRRNGWGTHFGFDYRDVDDRLEKLKVPFQALNSGFSRFYIVQPGIANQPD